MLRDLILKATDCPLTPVEIPEWGVTLCVRKFDGHEAARIRKLLADPAEDTDARVACSVALDQDGNRVFTDDDAPELLKKSNSAVVKLVKAALKANGLDLDETEAKKG